METPKKNNRVSDEDTIKFLILCIKYSDNGKVKFQRRLEKQREMLSAWQVNWEAVAEESGIVSKGAA